MNTPTFIQNDGSISTSATAVKSTVTHLPTMPSTPTLVEQVVPEGIRITDQKTYDILHDALNDFIAAPINRANHVQALLNGINLKSHSYETMTSNFTSTLVEHIVELLKKVYPDSKVIVTTMTHDNRLETFFINVEQVVEELVYEPAEFGADSSRMTTKKVHYFQNFICGSRYIKFINCVMPTGSSFAKLQSFFTGLIPPKAFTVKQYDPSGARTLPIKSETCVIYPEFYPFIPEGPDRLIDDFYASRSSVLILSGIAGSGKSSLIRRFFSRREDHTFIMVDNSAVYSDPKAFSELVNMVHEALAEEETKGKDEKRPVTLILEEADYAIQSKDNDAAGTLGRLLSLSDGVVKHNVKFVITSNLPTVDRIDANLRRNGRTYKVISFRTITPEEANIARGAINLDPIENFGVNNMTLAIALNYQETDEYRKDIANSQKRQVGFTA